ncbi:MAG: hypothetical protein KJ727_06915 [Acidobacteria bacterium]|nr:hypothetical protein [Acidobacteriota bacterium]MBU4495611.1 hypothetical protein [Acidobacteriota bacterium]
MKWLDSKWQRYMLQGDGGYWSDELHLFAHGYHLPGTLFYFPTATELEDCLTYYWTECKKKGKRGYYCHWTGEIFRDDNLHWRLWIENCRNETIDWGLQMSRLRCGKIFFYVLECPFY